MDKVTIRKLLLNERLTMQDRQLCDERLQQVLRIWLLNRDDTVIGAYWPIKAEFDPLPALYRWQEDGSASFSMLSQFGLHPTPEASNIFLSTQSRASLSLRKIGLPVVGKESKTLAFHAWYPGCPMQKDAYDIPKPQGTEQVHPTLLLIPCLGFNNQGYRLGYGGGFYDRTLASLKPRPFTVGLAFASGLAENFEPKAHDIALDVILTDEGIAHAR